MDFMTRHNDVELTLLGASPIIEDEAPVELINQIKFEPIVPHARLLLAMHEYDLSLAPLIAETEFNMAKSAVKILHAAAVGVRTLASATQETSKMISELDCGIAISEIEGWASALESEYSSWSRRITDRDSLSSRTIELNSIDRLSSILEIKFAGLRD